MWALYRVDVLQVLASSWDLRLVSALLGRLPHEPWSLYRARLLNDHPPTGDASDDDRAWLGWTRTETVLADLWDAMRDNTAHIAVHGTRAKPKRLPPYPGRPSSRPVAKSLDEVLSWFN